MGSTDQAALSREGDIHALVRRNTIVLAACLALSWSVVQLLVVVAAPVLSELTGRPSLAGLAPAIYLVCWALATLAAGRYMDARGRASGIRLGFLAGALGCLLVFLGTRDRSLILFLPGLALAGGGSGAVNLARAGAADMYPPERRARGISFVLVGAAFGAILGPVAFIPLLARSGSDLHVLATPAAAAAVVMLAGGALTLAIRIDPLEIGRSLRPPPDGSAEPGDAVRSLRTLLVEPVVRAALIAAVVGQTVMSSTMATISLVLHNHGHGWPAAAVTLSAHFLGMFGLVLVVGRLVDRIGRDRSVVAGMAVLAAGVLALLAEVEVRWVAPAMLIIGIGWNISFVAATAMLADATAPLERARLLGFGDFLAYGIAAAGVTLAGVVIGALGLGALVGFGIALSVLVLIVFVAHEPKREPTSRVIRLTEPEPRC
jgi:MFS family permease